MAKLKFGIYGGGAAGSDNGMARGPMDDPNLINEALLKLHSPNQNFLVRCYLHYKGNGKFENLTPLRPTSYLQDGRKLDLVLGYQSNNGDIQDWTKFIQNQISD
jgi:hypothetical protein